MVSFHWQCSRLSCAIARYVHHEVDTQQRLMSIFRLRDRARDLFQETISTYRWEQISWMTGRLGIWWPVSLLVDDMSRTCSHVVLSVFDLVRWGGSDLKTSLRSSTIASLRLLLFMSYVSYVTVRLRSLRSHWLRDGHGSKFLDPTRPDPWPNSTRPNENFIS